jgi:photosystem II stability/assembly factor-like uncharacterized protein
MNSFLKNASLLRVILVCFSTSLCVWFSSEKNHEVENENLLAPYENFLISRTFPNTTFDYAAFQSIINQASYSNKSKSNHQLNWNLEGPNNIGGRFNCVVSDPTDTSIIYAGAAQGGIFKTINAGQTWLPIFDNHSYLSIGNITIDPFNHNKLWVGTGDVNISGTVFLGDGLYLSKDAGNTWNYKGLSQTKVISQIEIDPTDSNTIYVGTMGNPFAKDNNRGLYKSTDGGTTWNKILYINDSTGIISLVIDPNNHNIIYASSYTRLRDYSLSLLVSNDCKIWQSTNGGNTWTAMTTGLPNYPVSRINLTAHPNNGNTIVYACIIDSTFNVDGIYKTNNHGLSWNASSINGLNPTAMNGQGWYYGNINVDPLDTNHLFLCGLELMESVDGGNNWTMANPAWWLYQVHADKHWLNFDANNNIIIATDGGLYKSNDGCATWRDIENIPASQFYHVAFNPKYKKGSTPYYSGGLQDNGTVVGNQSILNYWDRIYGGDGFQPAFDRNDSLLIYAETQYGNINYSTDGGFSFFQLSSGLNLDDSVKPWDMRYILSPFDNTNLYCGTDRVYKMTGSPFNSWQPISGKLTKPYFNGKRNNYITALAESPMYAGTLLAGTGDGYLWRCVNETNWERIDASLPNRYYTSVNFSYQNGKRYFTTLQGYRMNDNTPHIYRTDDSASTWNSIQGDLPNIGINDLYVIKQNDSFLLAATDAGLFATSNAGNHWENITSNIPICPIMDIELDTNFNKIIVGTYARSMWSISLDSIFDNIRNLLPQDTTTKDTTQHGNGLASIYNQHDVVLFPNHTAANFKIYSAEKIKSVIIFSISGMIMKDEKTNSELITEDIQNFPSGIYLVKVSTALHQEKIFKIIKE